MPATRQSTLQLAPGRATLVVSPGPSLNRTRPGRPFNGPVRRQTIHVRDFSSCERSTPRSVNAACRAVLRRRPLSTSQASQCGDPLLVYRAVVEAIWYDTTHATDQRRPHLASWHGMLEAWSLLHIREGRTTTGGSDEVLAQRMAAHDRLAHQSQVVLRLGQMLLSFGASAYRVKKSMADVARAVGISEHRAQVTYTEIITTAYAQRDIPHGAWRSSVSWALMRTRSTALTTTSRRSTVSRYALKTFPTSSTGSRRCPGLYDWFSNALASGLACAAFAFLNGGGWVECSAVAVASFFGQALRRQMLVRHMNHFGVWMACGALAAMIYILLVAPAQHFLGIESTHQAGFISALLFLVPGFPLVTGLDRPGPAGLPGRHRAPRVRCDACRVGRRRGLGDLRGLRLVCYSRVRCRACPMAALPAALPDEFRRGIRVRDAL